MPFTAYDADVSGDGFASFPGTAVIFVSMDITSAGLGVRPADVNDHLLRAGWFALCGTFNIGLGTFNYCDKPIYADFEHTRWVPNPTSDASGTLFTYIADGIRWYFSDGVTAHLHVFAF